MQAAIIGAAVAENGPAQWITTPEPASAAAMRAGSARSNARELQPSSAASLATASRERPASTGARPRSAAARAISRPV